MKKFLYILALVCAVTGSAQIGKGTFYVTGQMSFTHQKNVQFNNTRNSLTIAPTGGIFVTPTIAVGTGVGYSHSINKFDHSTSNEFFMVRFTGSNKQNSLLIAPFVRKYWALSENLYFFGQLEVPLVFGNSNIEANTEFIDSTGFIVVHNNNGKEKFTEVGFNVKPGLDYFINKNWSFEATLGEFGYINNKIQDSNSGSNFYRFGLDLNSVRIGVKYIFDR